MCPVICTLPNTKYSLCCASAIFCSIRDGLPLRSQCDKIEIYTYKNESPEHTQKHLHMFCREEKLRYTKIRQAKCTEWQLDVKMQKLKHLNHRTLLNAGVRVSFGHDFMLIEQLLLDLDLMSRTEECHVFPLILFFYSSHSTHINSASNSIRPFSFYI